MVPDRRVQRPWRNTGPHSHDASSPSDRAGRYRAFEGATMRLPKQDIIATVLVAAAGFLYLLWFVGSAPLGLSGTRADRAGRPRAWLRCVSQRGGPQLRPARPWQQGLPVRHLADRRGRAGRRRRDAGDRERRRPGRVDGPRWATACWPRLRRSTTAAWPGTLAPVPSAGAPAGEERRASGPRACPESPPTPTAQERQARARWTSAASAASRPCRDLWPLPGPRLRDGDAHSMVKKVLVALALWWPAVGLVANRVATRSSGTIDWEKKLESMP